ncbi:MAG TPA: class I SAM-dependent methyltransferase [Gaiellales bacterium]
MSERPDHTAEPSALRKLRGVFDGVAEDYDAARPGYPLELVDAAIAAGALDGGSRILEIGSGTGKLTELLVARGLRVHAIEPGANMTEAAHRRIGESDAVEFELSTFEAAAIPDGCYDAIFSATAFHWVEPRVGWAKAARALAPGGLLALLTHIGLEDEDERSEAMERKLVEILSRYAPTAARDWNLPLPFADVMAGARERSGNVSVAWDWIMSRGRHHMAIAEAAGLFRDVQVAAHVVRAEQTTDQVLAQWRTMSLYFMIEEERRPAFEEEFRALIDGFGGTFPFSDGSFLLTARPAAA